MTIQELESAASRGFKKDEESEGPDRDEIMTLIEIKNKVEELSKEIQQHGRWDKDIVARRTAAVIFYAARLAGMYGIHLEEAVRFKIEEMKKESTSAPDKPAGEMGKQNEKSIQRPKREFVRLPKLSKFKRPLRK